MARTKKSKQKVVPAVQPLPSRSALIRTEGNRLLKSVSWTLAPCVIETRLHKVLALYEEAAECATSEDDSASAWKNVACCWIRLLQHSVSDHQASGQDLAHPAEL